MQILSRRLFATMAVAAATGGCAVPTFTVGGSTTTIVGGSTTTTVGGSTTTTVGTTTSPSTTQPNTEPTGPAGQGPAWQPCTAPSNGTPSSNGLECLWVEVPVDYADPSLGTLNIAVGMHRATNPADRIGALFINPGGPGISGVEFLAPATSGPFPVLSERILERFDVISFDPRGVGASEPTFSCGDPKKWNTTINSFGEEIDTPDEENAARAILKQCTDSMGSVATRLGTDFVVQDMDSIRAAIGEENVSYLGFSYGSTLGAWYATRFPERVRAMVVDAADNPVDDDSSDQAIIESALDETAGIEKALRRALEACADASCPIYNNGDPVAFYLDHVDDLKLVNEEFDGNPNAGFLGLITPLYDETTWPFLWNGLAELANGNPELLAQAAQWQIGEQTGASDTATINCLDYLSLFPSYDVAESRRREELLRAPFAKQQPLLDALPKTPDLCPYLGEQSPSPLGRPFDGGDVPVVVVGNKSDPVTPYNESAELARDQLANGYFISTDVPSHVAYGESRCVTDAVDAVLIDAKPPTERTTDCEADDTPPSTTP